MTKLEIVKMVNAGAIVQWDIKIPGMNAGVRFYLKDGIFTEECLHPIHGWIKLTQTSAAFEVNRLRGNTSVDWSNAFNKSIQDILEQE